MALYDTSIEILELHQREIHLIKLIRSRFRFGEVTIKTRDGLPFRVIRIQEVEDLDNTLD